MAVAIVYSSLVLKRASASRPSGQWNEDDYDVLADGVVGRIFKDRTTTHGVEATREAAMAACARRRWRHISPEATQALRVVEDSERELLRAWRPTKPPRAQAMEEQGYE
jgi:hypothetical protein